MTGKVTTSNINRAQTRHGKKKDKHISVTKSYCDISTAQPHDDETHMEETPQMGKKFCFTTHRDQEWLYNQNEQYV